MTAWLSNSNTIGVNQIPLVISQGPTPIQVVLGLVPPSPSLESSKVRDSLPFNSLFFPVLALLASQTLSCRVTSNPRTSQLWGCLLCCGRRASWQAMPLGLEEALEPQCRMKPQPSQPSITAQSCSHLRKTQPQPKLPSPLCTPKPLLPCTLPLQLTFTIFLLHC